MKPTEMKARCAICKHYRLITYAAGNYAIGCMKASKDGEHPVDICKLDRCPREHAKKDSTRLRARNCSRSSVRYTLRLRHPICSCL
jgi:hypothetical protein